MSIPVNHIFIFSALAGERGAARRAADSAVTAICDTPIAVQLNFGRFEGESQLLILQYRLHKASNISAERQNAEYGGECNVTYRQVLLQFKGCES